MEAGKGKIIYDEQLFSSLILTLPYISCMNVSFALIGSSISSGGTFSLVLFVSAEPQYSDPTLSA